MQVMSNIQVRNVSKRTHAALLKQATASGMSLNSFLLAELDRIADRARVMDVLGRAHKLPGPRPTSEEIVRTIREGRNER